MKIVIVGGSDAGISAALRIRVLNETANVKVLIADDFPDFSISGLPFYLSGETPDWKQLAHRTEFEGIDVLRNHRATHIDADAGFVLAKHEGKSEAFAYDRLILGTGAVPVRPPIEGLSLPGVFLLHTMENSFQVQKHLTRENPKSALIIGAGYIGLEMADALTRRGLEVTLASRPRTVLPTVDEQLGMLVQQELQHHGVRLWTGVRIAQSSGSTDA